MGNERRRDYMVNTRVHLLYMVTWITSLLLVLAALGTWYAVSQIQHHTPAGPQILGVSPYLVIGGLVFVIVASALTLGVYTIVHTHRMLGSAYHIGMHLNRINSGTAPPQITLREGDYFREIADEINILQPRLPKSGGAPPAAGSPSTDPGAPKPDQPPSPAS